MRSIAEVSLMYATRWSKLLKSSTTHLDPTVYFTAGIAYINMAFLVYCPRSIRRIATCLIFGLFDRVDWLKAPHQVFSVLLITAGVGFIWKKRFLMNTQWWIEVLIITQTCSRRYYNADLPCRWTVSIVNRVVPDSPEMMFMGLYLLAGCVVFFVESEQTYWWSDWFKPNVHYIPIKVWIAVELTPHRVICPI